MCTDCWREFGSPQIDSPAVRVARDLIARVYDVSLTGGGLHVVVDDYNLDDATLDQILCQPVQAHARCGPSRAGFGLTLSKVERQCAEALRKMTVAERASALALFDGFWRSEAAA